MTATEVRLADDALESRRTPARRWLRSRLDAPAGYDGLFSLRARRLGVVYVVVISIGVTAGSAALPGQDSYLLLFALPLLLGYGAPTVVLSLVALRRAPRPRSAEEANLLAIDRASYLQWLLALVVICLVGLGIVLGVVTGSSLANPAGVPAVVAVAALLITGVVRLTRCRSGNRRLAVDLIEAGVVVLVVVAPLAVLWGDDVLGGDHGWFTVPAGLSFAGWVFGAYWVVALAMRVAPRPGAIEWLAMAFTLLATVDAAAQVAQGMSGFTLPTPPLIALQCACGSMALLVPLNLRRTAITGLDLQPPQTQVRVGYISTFLMMAGLPVLFAATVAVDDEVAWAVPFTFAVATAVVVLAGLRHLFGMHETRGLYAHIEEASDQRRRLLAQLMERSDSDRYRVTAELHQRAAATYAMLGTLLGGRPTPANGTGTTDKAVRWVRQDVARQVESLRQIMLAVRPLPAARTGARDPSAPIRAYLDNLYGDGPAPRLVVGVLPELRLDWVLESVALRIVQEALRNIRHHSRATEVHIGFGAADGVATLTITDDGVGFDPATAATGNGIAAMQLYAQVVDGALEVRSAPGGGTTVAAWLGPSMGPEEPAALRLIRGAGDA